MEAIGASKQPNSAAAGIQYIAATPTANLYPFTFEMWKGKKR